MNAPRRYTPLYEGMIVRWANLVAVQRYLAQKDPGPFRLVEIGVGSAVTANELVSDLIMRGVEYEYTGIDAMVDSESASLTLLHPNMRLIAGKSGDVSDQITNGIHFLFIDGDHRYEAAKKDHDLYAPKVVENGIIAMHDTIYTGAGRVVKEACRTAKYDLMLWSHEPIQHNDLTPGIAVMQKGRRNG